MFSVLLVAKIVIFLLNVCPSSMIHFKVKKDGLSSLPLADMTYTSAVTLRKIVLTHSFHYHGGEPSKHQRVIYLVNPIALLFESDSIISLPRPSPVNSIFLPADSTRNIIA